MLSSLFHMLPFSFALTVLSELQLEHLLGPTVNQHQKMKRKNHETKNQLKKSQDHKKALVLHSREDFKKKHSWISLIVTV